ncbi:MAG: biotin carboxylase N-terminal domain-containing protein, partial [Candidatus Binatus sp.]
MTPNSLLIANRGEIAIRIIRAAAEMGIRTVAVFPDDDATSLHTRKADEARRLSGVGAAAYLDGEQIIALATDAGCDAIHPGYGFLSENAGFARRCVAAGITFVGPRAEMLELFGNKVQARALAERCGVPILRGTSGPTSLDEARRFFLSLGEGASIMIKAVAGGGGRGMRAVSRVEEIEGAYKRCQSEARTSFGNGDVYVEQLMPRARHIEVQIIGDVSGNVSHLWERECSIQRRNQKIVEMAPSPGLAPALRDRLTAAAVRMAKEVRYDNLGTFEFLVNGDAPAQNDEAGFAFIEANPRLQVEHTVTEEVTGIDLVKLQIQLAAGRSLAELGMQQADIPKPRGFAMQVRINMESMRADGSAKPAGGTITAFEAPSGPRVRTDSFAYTGYTTSPNFDSLLAKLIAHSHSADFADVVTKTYRALCEFRIEGVPTNIGFLQSLLRHPEFLANRNHTRFVEDNIAELVGEKTEHRRLLFDQPNPAPRAGTGHGGERRAGAKIDASDPLAVLHHGKSASNAPSPIAASTTVVTPQAHDITAPENTVAIEAPMQGTIVSIDVSEGDRVHRGRQLFVMEAMKMEHVIAADKSGIVRRITVATGDAIFEGHPLAFIEEADVETTQSAETREVDLDRVRPDLAEVVERHALGLDAARPDAVARRRKT